MKKEKVVNKIRVSKWIFILGLLFFCVIIGRLIYLNLSETVDGINLSEFAKNRNTTKETLYATRGTIYDYNGETFAQSVDSYTLIAYINPIRSKGQKKPQHVVDKNLTAEKLAPILKLTKERIYELLDQEGLYQVEFGPNGKGLTELQKEEIEKLKLPGLDFIATSKRYYPNLDFASYTLGYVKENEDGDMNGEMGVELYYNDELTGTNGSLTYQQDASGYKLINSPEVRIEKVDGMDIYLTIDSNVQLVVERALNTYFNESGALSGGVIVADAKTGKILASASRPSFDPNKRDMQSYLDPLISSAFEPGSTMKTYTYMTALEKGTYKGDDKFTSGSITLSDYTIHDWNGYGWGEITYDYGYYQSSNIGIANLVTKYINKDDLLKYYEKLGFGKKTGIELPGEVTGRLSFKYDIEVANAGFGQGITTTPIQHIQALTSISNDGYLLKPTIIEKIVDSNTKKTIYEYNQKKGTKVAKIETVNKMKDLMWGVVNSGQGTGSIYAIDGYDVIGKTGTAQMVDPNTGLYFTGDYYSVKSFEGMYPKDNPKFIFYIYLERAAVNMMPEMLTSILKDVETYYNITRVNTKDTNTYAIENFLNKDINYARNNLNLFNIKYEVIGNGNKIVSQYPKAGSIINGKVFLLTNSSSINIPNMNGYSRKDAINLCKLLNLEYAIEGNGYVKEYSVEQNNGKPSKIFFKLSDKY